MAKKIPAFRLKPMPMEETAMNRSNGQVIEESNDPDGQAHHIVPFETRTHELVQRAARGGFNMNGANNGIRLDLSQHLGSHPKYNSAITKKLDEILRTKPNISDVEAAELLQNYVDKLRAGLERSTSMLH